MKRPFGVTPAASFMRSRHLIAVNHRSDRAAFGLRGKTKPSRHNVLDSWKAFDPPCEGQSRTAFRTPSAQSRKSSMPSGFFSESSTPLTSMTTPQSGDQRPASQPTPSSRDQHNGSYFLLQRVPMLGSPRADLHLHLPKSDPKIVVALILQDERQALNADYRNAVR